MKHEGTPDEHLFIPVPHQSGCERCGYAKGHHPSANMLRAIERNRARQAETAKAFHDEHDRIVAAFEADTSRSLSVIRTR